MPEMVVDTFRKIGNGAIDPNVARKTACTDFPAIHRLPSLISEAVQQMFDEGDATPEIIEGVKIGATMFEVFLTEHAANQDLLEILEGPDFGLDLDIDD
jgi:hypothetical protein